MQHYSVIFLTRENIEFLEGIKKKEQNSDKKKQIVSRKMSMKAGKGTETEIVGTSVLCGKPRELKPVRCKYSSEAWSHGSAHSGLASTGFGN